MSLEQDTFSVSWKAYTHGVTEEGQCSLHSGTVSHVPGEPVSNNENY